MSCQGEIGLSSVLNPIRKDSVPVSPMVSTGKALRQVPASGREATGAKAEEYDAVRARTERTEDWNFILVLFLEWLGL